MHRSDEHAKSGAPDWQLFVREGAILGNHRIRSCGACHCAMCRRWCAGPFLYVECGDSLQFQASACLGIYRSSPWAERGFCSQCGSTLYYKMLKTASYSVSAEAFDQSDYHFTSQIFIDRKPSYYSFRNETHNTREEEWFEWLRTNE